MPLTIDPETFAEFDGVKKARRIKRFSENRTQPINMLMFLENFQKETMQNMSCFFPVYLWMFVLSRQIQINYVDMAIHLLNLESMSHLKVP